VNNRAKDTLRPLATSSKRIWAAVVLFSLTMLVSYPSHVQTLTVLHSFTGATDGAIPFGSVSLENAGLDAAGL
jgi:hypothetical protein